MRIHLALAALVLLAGCTGGGGGLPQPTGGNTPTASGSKTSSGELTVYLSGLPEKLEGTDYFTITAEATEDISDVQIVLYNLGSYLESSCSGTNSIRDLASGQKKEISCSLKATDTPMENINQEIMFEASYRISKYTGQVAFRIYDAEEYDRVKPSEGEASADLKIGNILVSPENAREGESISIQVDLGGELATGGSCGCNIEKLLLKIPSGFSLSGQGWTRSTCGGFNCYEKRNLDAPIAEDMALSIAGVTKTETFYVGVEVGGIWKLVRGSDTVVVPA